MMLHYIDLQICSIIATGSVAFQICFVLICFNLNVNKKTSRSNRKICIKNILKIKSSSLPPHHLFPDSLYTCFSFELKRLCHKKCLECVCVCARAAPLHCVNVRQRGLMSSHGTCYRKVRKESDSRPDRSAA